MSEEHPVSEPVASDAEVDEPVPPEADDAGESRRPYTGREKAVLVLAILAIVVSTVLIGRNFYHDYRRARSLREEAPMMMGCGEADWVPEPAGSPEAKLRIEACMGHCVSDTMRTLAAMAAAWPDKIRAEFYAYGSPEGMKLVHDHGLELACILLNGEKTFTLQAADGKSRTVTFHGPPGENYRMADVVAVLKMKLRELYGAVPDDFDVRVKAILGHPPAALPPSAATCR